TRPITSYVADALGMTHGVRLLEVLALLMLCLLSGLLMRSTKVGGLRNWLEENFLFLLPGYEYIRMRMNETLTQEGDTKATAILVRLDDSWSPARLIETGDDGTSVVFVPDTPQGNSGAVLVVETDRVQHLNVPYAKLVESVRHYGRGLQAIKTKARS
ncbi:MAG TPA: hypothetical protein PLA11_16590, partial [Flavobacteriales bacterium]|nr:hypothetical protein [Flavobacteriales bacterium]